MGACVLWLSVFCYCVVNLLAQNSPCSTINSQYVWNNLENLTVGLSNIQRLKTMVLSPMLHPRIPSTDGSRRAREHIKTWMATVGWTVEEDSFQDNTPYGRLPFSNVIATLDPTKSRRVVFACHYDTKIISRSRFVGATDSAVPCAVMMDSALRLYQMFQRTKGSNSDLTIQFLFFDGEEAFWNWSDQDSLYGSRHLADRWARTDDRNFPGQSYINTIESFILLDLIGTPDTTFSLRFTETASIYNKLSDIETCLQNWGHLDQTQSPHSLFSSRTDTSIIEDDHLPFLRRGVPVVHLISSPFPRVWHTPNDDMPALDMTLIDNFSRVLRVFMADLPL